MFPNLTVAENIAFNHQLSERRRLVSWREVRRIAKQGLGKVGVAVPLDALVEQLSVADKQVVAIARALVQGARLIAMDEATTALTEREVKSLFDIVRRLKADGVAVIFISHKLSEIFAICERVIVLRNGVKVADGPARALTWSPFRNLCSAGGSISTRARAPTNQASSFCGSRSSAATGGFRTYLSHCTPERCLASPGFSALAGPLWPGRCSASSGGSRSDIRLRTPRARRLASRRDQARHRLRSRRPADQGLFLPQSIARNLVVSNLDRLTDAAGVLLARACAAWSTSGCGVCMS